MSKSNVVAPDRIRDQEHKLSLLTPTTFERDDAMAAHLDVPHVGPEQSKALEKKLGEIEKRLDDALAPKATIGSRRRRSADDDHRRSSSASCPIALRFQTQQASPTPTSQL